MFPVPRFLVLVLFITLSVVSGNVEKEIFTSPYDTRDQLPRGDQSVKSEVLHSGLLRLDPSSRCEGKSCRDVLATLDTSFLDLGKRHWAVLDNLERGKRYEVRICWAATSPTDFTLNVYTQTRLLSRPELLADMTAYATHRLPSNAVNDVAGDAAAAPQSALYLEIQAKAGYYTHDKLRMESPDPVRVEIILDPFIFNILPESLLPIGIAIILAGLLAVWMSGHIYNALRSVALSSEGSQRAKKSL